MLNLLKQDMSSPVDSIHLAYLKSFLFVQVKLILQWPRISNNHIVDHVRLQMQMKYHPHLFDTNVVLLFLDQVTALTSTCLPCLEKKVWCLGRLSTTQILNTAF